MVHAVCGYPWISHAAVLFGQRIFHDDAVSQTRVDVVAVAPHQKDSYSVVAGTRYDRAVGALGERSRDAITGARQSHRIQSRRAVLEIRL